MCNNDYNGFKTVGSDNPFKYPKIQCVNCGKKSPMLPMGKIDYATYKCYNCHENNNLKLSEDDTLNIIAEMDIKEKLVLNKYINDELLKLPKNCILDRNATLTIKFDAEPSIEQKNNFFI
jgi:DNA-directed RNA polymerase subunit RPC12/RpoP